MLVKMSFRQESPDKKITDPQTKMMENKQPKKRIQISFITVATIFFL